MKTEGFSEFYLRGVPIVTDQLTVAGFNRHFPVIKDRGSAFHVNQTRNLSLCL